MIFKFWLGIHLSGPGRKSEMVRDNVMMTRNTNSTSTKSIVGVLRYVCLKIERLKIQGSLAAQPWRWGLVGYWRRKDCRRARIWVHIGRACELHSGLPVQSRGNGPSASTSSGWLGYELQVQVEGWGEFICMASKGKGYECVTWQFYKPSSNNFACRSLRSSCMHRLVRGSLCCDSTDSENLLVRAIAMRGMYESLFFSFYLFKGRPMLSWQLSLFTNLDATLAQQWSSRLFNSSCSHLSKISMALYLNLSWFGIISQSSTIIHR